MHPSSWSLRVILPLAITFISVLPALASDRFWSTNASGSFQDAANWDSGVPGPGDNAFFTNGNSFTVTFSADALNNAAYFQSTGGTVTLDIGASAWTVTSAFELGTSPGTSSRVQFTSGRLFVTNGAGDATMHLGVNPASGTFLVDGGTAKVDRFTLTNGYVSRFAVARGAFTVRNGMTFNAGNREFLVGNVSGYDAVWNLRGGNSYFASTTGRVSIGNVTNARGIVGLDGGCVFTTTVPVAVGYASAGNRMVVTGGSVFAAGDLYFGYGTNADLNEVRVDGVGSELRSADNLLVGNYGHGNKLVATNGGVVSATYVWLGLGDDPYGGGTPTMGSTNDVDIAGSGSVLSNSGSIYVGYYGGNNRFAIRQGARVYNGSFYLGYYGPETGNTCEVSGSGSSLTNSGSLFVGYGQPGCTMLVTTGATVQSAFTAVGYQGSRNKLGLYGTNVALDADAVQVGDGSDSGIDAHGGAWIKSRDVTVGSFNGGSGSWVRLSGPGTTWSNRDTYRIGGNLSPNSTVTTTNGAFFYTRHLQVGNGSEVRTTNCEFRATGAGTYVQVQSNLSASYRGQRNRVVVEDGAYLQCLNDAHIGGTQFASNDEAVVRGGGSILSVQSNLVVGYVGGGNRITVTNGGFVTNRAAYLAYENFGPNNDGNAVVVSGPSSTWHSMYFTVGRKGNQNRFEVEGGAKVYFSTNMVLGDNAGTRSNLVIVRQSPSLLQARTLNVGFGGGDCRMQVEQGGAVSSMFAYVGNGTLSTGNSVVVTGTGSAWSVQNSLYVGYNGTHNTLLIQTGGVVQATMTYVGGFGPYNNVVIDGPGSELRSLFLANVGFIGHSVTVAVRNAGTLYVGETLTTGYGPLASNSSVEVEGGRVVVTNDGIGVIDVRYGRLWIKSGEVEADAVSTTNGLNNELRHDGGTMRTPALYTRTNVPHRVGNGVDPAALFLRGGTSRCPAGFFTSTNAALYGTGTVVAPTTTVFGTIAPGASAGSLAFQGALQFGDAALFDVELGGYGAGTQFDTVDASGEAGLGGTLRCTAIGGFAPTAGDRFDVLRADSLANAFTQLVLSGFSPLAVAEVVHAGSTVQVHFVDADVDGDGMADLWETQYFGGATNATASADGDLDRFNNLAEFLADTHPGDGGRHPRILRITDGAIVQFDSSTGRRYRVDTSTNLLGAAWTAGTNEIAGSGGMTSIVETTGAGQKTFRLRIRHPLLP